jgi:hypothetical protein
MIIPFKLDPEVVSTYRTAKTVRSVVHRMGGANNQGDFTYHGKSKDGGIKEHRIREIQECGDLGTSYTNASSYFSHHTTAAVSELDSQLDQWDFMAKHLGRGDVFERVDGFITRTGERIDPACFAIHEADIDGQAKKSYQDVCDRWAKRCSCESRSYKVQKNLATKSQRGAIRQAEVAKAKEILEGFRGDLAAWLSQINAQIQ